MKNTTNAIDDRNSFAMLELVKLKIGIFTRMILCLNKK